MSITATSSIQFFWQTPAVAPAFQSGVSLHSHTMCSEESLSMVPKYTCRVPYLGDAIRRQQSEYSRYNSKAFNFADAFWTPPLAPRQAYRLEEKQVQRRFKLPALVSLTDHDDTRAASMLRVMDRFRKVPISIPSGPSRTARRSFTWACTTCPSPMPLPSARSSPASRQIRAKTS